MKRLLCSLVFTFGTVFISSNVVADHIDSFEDGGFTVATTTFATDTQLGLSGVEGGARTVEVFAGGGGNAVTILTPDAGSLDDSVTFATDSTTVGVFQFLYGGYSVAGDLNLDLVNRSPTELWSELAIDYISSATGTSTITISDGTAMSAVSQSFGPGTSTLGFSYNDFELNSIGGTIDLTDVDSIRLDLVLTDAPNPSSLSISNFYRGGIVAVPEPASLAPVLILTIVGATRRRRR